MTSIAAGAGSYSLSLVGGAKTGIATRAAPSGEADAVSALQTARIPRPEIPADKAYDTLKTMFIMEQISGKTTDPQVKFDLVSQAAPQYLGDLKSRLADLPPFPQDNTSRSEEEATELFERMEIFAWALSSSTAGLADTAGNIPPSAPMTRHEIAGRLFELVDETAEAAARGDEVMAEPDAATETPGLKDSIEALADRDDDYGLIGQFAEVFHAAWAKWQQNPELLGDGTMDETEDRIMRIFSHLEIASYSLQQYEARYGNLPSDRFELRL